MDTTEKVTIRLPKRFVDRLDFLVKMDDFPTRSEAIRVAVRDLVYARVDMLMDKLEKFQEAEEKFASMKAFQEEYLRK